MMMLSELIFSWVTHKHLIATYEGIENMLKDVETILGSSDGPSNRF